MKTNKASGQSVNNAGRNGKGTNDISPKERREKMQFKEAITAIEENTCFRLTAATDKESAFFVPVAKDGETVIGDAFELTRAKIMQLAKLEKPHKPRA